LQINNLLDLRYPESIHYIMMNIQNLLHTICMATIAACIVLAIPACDLRLYAPQGPSPAGTGRDATGQALLKGGIIADEISRATGFAISPILGPSVLGFYAYYTTPTADRDRMPWYEGCAGCDLRQIDQGRLRLAAGAVGLQPGNKQADA